MNESGNHYSQQTDTRTENQTLHVHTHRQVLNKENTGTQGGEHHTPGSLGRGQGRDSRGVGRLRGIALGEISNVDDGAIDAANHHHVICIPM